MAQELQLKQDIDSDYLLRRVIIIVMYSTVATTLVNMLILVHADHFLVRSIIFIATLELGINL